MTPRFVLHIALSLTMLCLAATAQASILRPGMANSTLAANDDDSSEAVRLGFQIDFFGEEATRVFVNNNGNVTFHSAMRRYTSEPLSAIDRPIIAPFFADVDTANGIGSPVTYGRGFVGAHKAFAVNWVDVNYFSNFMHPEQTNSFQLVIIDRQDTGKGNFDIEFNYDRILWESGTSSGGNAWGLGGDAARAGFSAGTDVPGAYVELAGSGVAGSFIDGGTHALSQNSNVDLAGRYIFAVRDGIIHVPSAVPVPGALPFLCVGLLCFGALKRLKRS